jgi:hypothetical protein
MGILQQKHDIMKHAAIGFLESIGATSIELEHRIELDSGEYPGSVTVDIMAKSADGRVIMIECGSIHSAETRLPTMISNCDIFYWVPMTPFIFMLQDHRLQNRVLTTPTGVTLPCKCLRCGYEWFPRISRPKVCPSCKSYDWF